MAFFFVSLLFRCTLVWIVCVSTECLHCMARSAGPKIEYDFWIFWSIEPKSLNFHWMPSRKLCPNYNLMCLISGQEVPSPSFAPWSRVNKFFSSVLFLRIAFRKAFSNPINICASNWWTNGFHEDRKKNPTWIGAILIEEKDRDEIESNEMEYRF